MININIVEMLKNFYDRPKIILKYRKGKSIERKKYYGSDTYLFLNVVNAGKRPIKIERAGFIRKPKQEYDMIGRPCVLSDYNPKIEFISPEDIELNEIEYFFAVDAREKIYKKYVQLFGWIPKIKCLCKK